jgi:DNA-directed RNA polymerase specialized sigma24 family protein
MVDFYESLAIKQAIARALNKINKLDKDAIVFRFIDGHTIAEIAILMNVSKHRICQRIERGLRKMRMYHMKDYKDDFRRFITWGSHEQLIALHDQQT